MKLTISPNAGDALGLHTICMFSFYSGLKINETLVNVTVRGEKIWKGQEGSAMAKSLSEHV
jgi:hypothetical protein